MMQVLDKDFTLPIGKAKVMREGDDGQKAALQSLLQGLKKS